MPFDCLMLCLSLFGAIFGCHFCMAGTCRNGGTEKQHGESLQASPPNLQKSSKTFIWDFIMCSEERHIFKLDVAQNFCFLFILAGGEVLCQHFASFPK